VGLLHQWQEGSGAADAQVETVTDLILRVVDEVALGVEIGVDHLMILIAFLLARRCPEPRP